MREITIDGVVYIEKKDNHKKILELVLIAKPVTNNTKSRIINSPKGAYASYYKPKETKEHEQDIRSNINSYMIINRIRTNINAVKVVIYTGVPIPRSFSKKKREQAISGLLLPKKRPDLDNYTYLIKNSLKPSKKYTNLLHILSDDSLICDSVESKRYAERPFIKIEIYDMEQEEVTC